MEVLSENIQRVNLFPEEVISRKCLKIENKFLDDVIYSVLPNTFDYKAEKINGNIECISTKNKISIIF